jgi:hypothetical protein
MKHTARMLSSYDPDKYRDIHDAKAIRNLLDKKVVIGGECQSYSYFEDQRDIPLGLMTDGFQYFKHVHRDNASVWPVILLNFGRPPSQRMKLENIIPFAIFPGPKQPKDFNSFLFPLYEELNQLAKGIKSFDGECRKHFDLHAFLVSAIGDMPASKHLSGMNGLGAMHPCRVCNIRGILHLKRYYVPLKPPKGYNTADLSRGKYEPSNLPMRTQQTIESQIREIEGATKAHRTELSRKYGIKSNSVIANVSGFQRVLGFPHEFMHLVFLNIIPMMIRLWKGAFFQVDHRDQPYIISSQDWQEIGRFTSKSVPFIPSSFSRAIPNINTEQHLFTAESYAFWFLYMAPILLRDRFRESRYYDHAIHLVRIIQTCIQYEITTKKLDELEEKIIVWVRKFEK